ncbi:MAG: 3-deoxy-D-manno-octulosonic acid kinase [Pseudomonadota bacterium]|nr:3-deoxy-D-manno-octulosonic acid kinase [Pseudomonadota bacterium]
MVESKILRGKTSMVLYDESQLNEVPEAWFQESFWRDRDAILTTVSGRGSVFVLDSQPNAWVLRHYRRGGLVARFVDDHYVWLGAERTRAFREWRFLASLLKQGLPVPRPVAAAVFRQGPVYKADIITTYLRDTRSLASLISDTLNFGPALEKIGRTLRTFHEKGVYHADLTAHNILMDLSNGVYLVDFDRGAFRRPGSWCQGNLDRLKRSLRKVAAETGTNLKESDWQRLKFGYGA